MKDWKEDPSRKFVHGAYMGERFPKILPESCGRMHLLSGGRMYKPRKLLQVVGHTPVEAITKKSNLISCDIFST